MRSFLVFVTRGVTIRLCYFVAAMSITPSFPSDGSLTLCIQACLEVVDRRLQIDLTPLGIGTVAGDGPRVWPVIVDQGQSASTPF